MDLLSGVHVSKSFRRKIGSQVRYVVVVSSWDRIPLKAVFGGYRVPVCLYAARSADENILADEMARELGHLPRLFNQMVYALNGTVDPYESIWQDATLLSSHPLDPVRIGRSLFAKVYEVEFRTKDDRIFRGMTRSESLSHRNCPSRVRVGLGLVNCFEVHRSQTGESMCLRAREDDDSYVYAVEGRVIGLWEPTCPGEEYDRNYSVDAGDMVVKVSDDLGLVPGGNRLLVNESVCVIGMLEVFPQVSKSESH